MDTPGERGGNVRRTGRWRALTLLAATLVLAMSTWFSASAVIPQLRVQWDLSDSAAAWLTIAVQLGFVFSALISSLVNLSDIISPRHVISGGAVGAAAVNGLLVIEGGSARSRRQRPLKVARTQSTLVLTPAVLGGLRERLSRRVGRH